MLKWHRIPLLYRVSIIVTVYKTVWNPEINKYDVCIDQYNERDRYAMKIKIGDELLTKAVGHVPIELSKLVAHCRN